MPNNSEKQPPEGAEARKKNQMELREIDISEIEIGEETRENGEKSRKITGYAANFEKLSLDLGGFKEKIARGAFSGSIRENDVVMIWNHNTDFPLARSSNGTLSLQEDEKGLRFELQLGDDHMSDYAFKSIRSKNVKGMSFGFRTLKDKWEINDKKEYIRTLESIYLIEISPTAFPAYPSTSVNARSADELLIEARAALGIADEPPAAEKQTPIALRLQQLRVKVAC